MAGFKKLDLNEIKKLQEQFQNQKQPQSDYRWASLPEKGETLKIRFLPPVGEMNLPFFKLYKHYQVPSPEEGTLNFTCLKTWGLECPICKKIEELKRKFGDELVSQWFASMRGFFNILIKDDPNYISGLPYILGMPKSGIVWFLQTIGDDEVGDITDPYTGFWVKVTRQENNQLRFDIIPKPSPIASTDDEINQIAEQCFDLTKIWRHPDDEYLITANKIAEKIEIVVKEKAGLLDTGTSIIESPKQIKPETTYVSKPTPTSQPVESQVKSNQSSVQKPPGAPECFGQFNEDDTRCMICIHEIECRQASQKGG